MNSEQSSNENDGPPRSTANMLNENPSIPQEMRENYQSLPLRADAQVFLQNPTMQIPQQGNYYNQNNPVLRTTSNEPLSYRTQAFHNFYTSLPNAQLPINVEQSSQHNIPSTSNSALPSEERDQAHYPYSNVSSDESQLPELQEFDVEASFAALNKLSILDVENMPMRIYTEYIRHALLCAENIANRNEQKYCFRNIEGICRRTRLEVEKENFTARNLYNQGYAFAIKDLIFALARTTNCWRILSGYYNAIKSNLLKNQVNTEISEDFLRCFEEWEKNNKRLTHNLFKTFSNLDFLYTDEENYQSQNEATRPRYTYQPYEETNQQQFLPTRDPPRIYREKQSKKSQNTKNIAKEWNQSEACGITRSPEYESSSSGENKKQPPVHQYQSWAHLPEKNKSPNTDFIFKPEQFPPLGERVRKYNRQSSMENASPSSSTAAIEGSSSSTEAIGGLSSSTTAIRGPSSSTEAIGGPSSNTGAIGGPSSSTGAIRKKINSNVKTEKHPAAQKQVATSQKQSLTGSVVTDSNDIKTMEYVGPSTGAIKKKIFLNKPEENQMHRVCANSRAIKKTKSVGLKQEPILSHDEQFQTHFMQPSIQNTGSNSDFMDLTGNHSFETIQTSTVNQDFLTSQMQYPTANPGLANHFVWMTDEHISVVYHQEDYQCLTPQMQPSTLSTDLRSNFTEMTNYYEQQPTPNAYLQSSESYGNQHNLDQTTANYSYEGGSHEASSRGSHELYQRGLYEPSSRGSYEPSRRGSYDPSSRGSYDPSSRGSYEPSSRGSYEPSRRGSYELSRRGSYEPSSRGSYEPSSRGSYEPSRRGSYEPSRRGSYEPSRGHAHEPSRRGRYHDHFAYDRGISLIPKGYNYLVQFSYKAMNVDKYEEQLLKDAELLAKNTAAAVLNDQDDDTNLDTKLKTKHTDTKILSIKLKKIWIRLEETHFMLENIQKTHFLFTLYCAELNKPVNLLAVGNRILNLAYNTAVEFVKDIRLILLCSSKFFADDIGYQINLSMFNIVLNDVLKEVFPESTFD